MEHIRIKSIKRDACDFGYNNNMYNNNTSQPKYITDNLEEAKAQNTYFGQNGYSGDNKQILVVTIYICILFSKLEVG